MLQGKNLYPSDPNAYFEFIYPPLPAVLLAIPSYFGKMPLYTLPVAAQRRGVVDDRAILQRDDGLGADTRSVAVCAAGLRDGLLCVRHVRSRAAQPRAAGDDVVRILVAAARAAAGWREACSRWRPRSRFSRSRCCPICCGDGSGSAAASMAIFVGIFLFVVPAPVRGFQHNVAELKTWYQGMVGTELGKGIRPARRAELVVGQSIHHRGDAPADAPGQLRPGRSVQAAALHESARSRFQDRELDRALRYRC